MLNGSGEPFRPLGPFGRRCSKSERSFGCVEGMRNQSGSPVRFGHDADATHVVAAVVLQLPGRACITAVMPVMVMVNVVGKMRCRRPALVLAIARHRSPRGLKGNSKQEENEQEQALHRAPL